MQNDELKKLIEQATEDLKILRKDYIDHDHDGSDSKQVHDINLFGSIKSRIPATSATIGTAAGNYDAYVIAPISGQLESIDFSAVDALATNDTNYITWTITNLGQAGAGTTVMLITTPAGINTTKATGGTAIAANTKYPLTVSVAVNAPVVQEGDRLLIRAAVTGTLANAVTFPTYMLRFK